MNDETAPGIDTIDAGTVIGIHYANKIDKNGSDVWGFEAERVHVARVMIEGHTFEWSEPHLDAIISALQAVKAEMRQG